MSGLPSGSTVLLDDGTGTYPYDISSYVLTNETLTWQRGRPDETQQVEPGTLTLTLNNTDGRFTQGNATYHVQTDQAIRVTIGGTRFFTGRVQSWPVQWPGGSQQNSQVTITASDDLAKMSRRTLRSAIDEDFAADGVAAHWPMGEQNGATGADEVIGTGGGTALATWPGPDVITISGTDFNILPIFGVDLGVADASTGVTIKGTNTTLTQNRFLYAYNGTFSTTDVHAEMLFKLAAPSAGQCRLWVINGMTVTYNGDGTVTVSVASGNFTVGTGLDDAKTHVIAVEAGSAGTDIYLDNVLAYHDTTAVGGTFDLGLVFVGTSIGSTPADITTAHFNVGPRITSTRVGVHYTVITTDYLGETPTARLTRVASYIGITTGSLDSVGGTTCSRANQEGKSGLEVVNEVAEATDGIAFVDANGALSNVTGYTITQQLFPTATLDAMWFDGSTQVVVDMQFVVNRATGQMDGSQNRYTFTDAASINGSGTNPPHGVYPADYTWHVGTDLQARDRTSWKVKTYAQPQPRVPSMTADLLSMDAITLAAALTIDLGEFFNVPNMPSQTPGGDQYLIAQGISMTLGDHEWSLTINGQRHAQSAAWILDDGFFGVLGASTKLYA